MTKCSALSAGLYGNDNLESVQHFAVHQFLRKRELEGNSFDALLHHKLVDYRPKALTEFIAVLFLN
jgi:hypothetical protein